MSADWLTRQAEVSARRLAATDPTLLSPVGRDLRDVAMKMIEPIPHLRLIHGEADE